ncbi:hypothetical protein [Aeromonas hydrophila]|uniref:hypothetical protein n=2 Tax=Aeromonas hydrophila TaxID=644 RepID=UPI0038D1D456
MWFMATSRPALQIRPRLEKNHQEQTIVLNDEQIRLLDQRYPDEPVEQMQTGLDSYLEHYNKQWSCQGLMMKGQAPLLHAQEGSEIGTEEGARLEWCKQETGLRPASGGNYICACYYQLTNGQQYSLTCS